MREIDTHHNLAAIDYCLKNGFSSVFYNFRLDGVEGDRIWKILEKASEEIYGVIKEKEVEA